MQDKLNAERQKLPMYQVTKEYVFTDTAGKDYDLAQLFGPKHDQLILVHFMWDPSWPKGCQSCSMWADAYSGIQACARGVVVVLPARNAESNNGCGACVVCALPTEAPGPEDCLCGGCQGRA